MNAWPAWRNRPIYIQDVVGPDQCTVCFHLENGPKKVTHDNPNYPRMLETLMQAAAEKRDVFYYIQPGEETVLADVCFADCHPSLTWEPPLMARPTGPGQTPVDYVTIVLSPVLIMGLVGGLVFFLAAIGRCVVALVVAGGGGLFSLVSGRFAEIVHQRDGLVDADRIGPQARVVAGQIG